MASESAIIIFEEFVTSSPFAFDYYTPHRSYLTSKRAIVCCRSTIPKCIWSWWLHQRQLKSFTKRQKTMSNKH